jgi:hypothetical protein
MRTQCAANYSRSIIVTFIYFSHGQPTALEALQCGPSTVSEKRYFGEKPTRPFEKIQILALKMSIFRKCGPRADLGWPWLIYFNVASLATNMYNA